jgi:ATP adenylyltransferase
MKNLHVYWRIDYVEILQSEKSKDKDPFLEIPKEDQALSLLIFKNEFSYVALNKFPYDAGHSMVTPYHQVASVQELTQGEYLDICQSVLTIEKC